eukprot:5837214-Pyramimonas_sp.AAC.1
MSVSSLRAHGVVARRFLRETPKARSRTSRALGAPIGAPSARNNCGQVRSARSNQQKRLGV